jgi:hypothetical protein
MGDLTVIVTKGESVDYSITLTGYWDYSGAFTISQNTTISRGLTALNPSVTPTITPRPSNGGGYVVSLDPADGQGNIDSSFNNLLGAAPALVELAILVVFMGLVGRLTPRRGGKK